MPDHRHQAGDADGQRVAAKPCHGHHHGRALAAVEKQGGEGKPLASRAKDVRRADIAAADGADVTLAGKARQDKPERQ